MKHIVSFSGGMGSFAEAKSCVDKYGKENVVLLFADTLMEDEDLYRFKDEVVAFLGCELVTLCYGMNVWDLFKDKKFIGNTRVDICSSTLKRDLLNGYIQDNYTEITKEFLYLEDGSPRLNVSGAHLYREIENYTCEVHLGIDFSEHHRLTRVQSYMKPMVYRSTLVEEGRIVPKDYSEQFGIKRPRLYDMGFGHNNCGGFCVKAGLGHFKLLHEKMPERYRWHEEQEKETIALGGKPFLRKTMFGVLSYYTMERYRKEFLEKGLADEDKFDIGGCSCALPLGEE